MSNFRIVFPNGNGGVAIFVPAPGTSQEDALKAVPPGSPYKIVDASEIPSDRTFRDAWEMDFSEPEEVVSEESQEE
jgi:hypothetical protein